jgi:Ca-activated chloride channel homolog
MSFDRPLLLLTLLVVPAAVALYVLAERRRMRYAIRFTNLDVLAGVLGGRLWRHYVPLALFLLALAALCVGVARPQRTTLVPSDRATVILVIDVSRSMQARDVKPNRIGAAQAAVRTFLDRAPKRLRVGLIAFAGEPAVATPPTTDHRLVREALDTIQWFPSFGGTAIGDALAEAVRVGQQAVLDEDGNLASVTVAAPTTSARGLVSILFLSDGAQHQGVLQPLEGAALAQEAGMPVYTVALGTPHGTVPGFDSGPFGGGGFFEPERIPVPPDPVTLRAIADQTGGEFTDARTAEVLTKAYEELGSNLGRTEEDKEVTYAFLLAAAGLLLGAGVLASAWSPRLP